MNRKCLPIPAISEEPVLQRIQCFTLSNHWVLRLTIKCLKEQISDKYVKRAGLDYWDKLDVRIYDDFDDFLAKNPGAKIYMATTKAARSYTDVQYEDDCYIMFGKESAGIPESILQKYQDTAVRIPMWGDIRSLNLSNSVAIVLYEALRQNNFLGLKMKGRPRTFDWD